MENKIKISDVVSIDISSLKDAKNCMDRLSELTKQYMSAEDINTLEQIKREFVSQLQFLAAIYSKFKKHKGPNHVYLEYTIKKIKAQAIDLLLSTGIKTTAAQELVYRSEYFTDRMQIIENVTQSLLAIELQYEQFNNTFQSILQSVSVANKDLYNSKNQV